jgi:GNAT superfamily N-acetyltransferase
MRLRHIPFGLAALCAATTFEAPMAWDRHALLVTATLLLVAVGLVGVVGAGLWDIVHPAPRHAGYSRRDLDRAYRAGHDTGAAEGPTDVTRRRWQREGFST